MVVSWEDTMEVFRSFPMALLVPFVLLTAMTSGVSGAHEFDVFRMYQYELHGKSFGCHGSQVHMEARSASATQLHRRCVVVHVNNLSVAAFDELIQRGAGAILVIVPTRLESALLAESWNALEQHLLGEEISVPVYFARETKELLQLHVDIAKVVRSEQAASVTENFLGVFASRGYQIVVAGGEAKAIKDATITTLVGKLAGRGPEHQLPTLAVVAHYDAHSVSPHLSFGSDSNGSGVIALLELARLFSRLYAEKKTRASFNLLFVLTGGGKYDFQGARHWIDSALESDENPLANAHYVMCLDSIGTGDGLHIHVSKPPKPGTPAFEVLSSLQEVARGMSLNFTLVHKKINLAEDRSAWEHERFSMKRVPAATLSHYASHVASKHRHTIYDLPSQVDAAVLKRNVHFLAEGIARYVYNLSAEGINDRFSVFNASQDLDAGLLSSWFDHFASLPRDQSLISRDHPLLTTLEQQLSRSCPTSRHLTKTDKKDPDYIFYDASKSIMVAHSIKPGIFDLVLAMAIAVYLLLIYGLTQVFPVMATSLHRLVFKLKTA